MESDEQNNQPTQQLDPNRRQITIDSNNIKDLSQFYRENRDLMDEDIFMKTVRGMMSYGNENVSLHLDLENNQNGVVGRATTEVQDGVAKAVIHLYQGADAMTVIHEFAHIGYDMMSAHD